MDTHRTNRVHRPDADLRRTAPAVAPRRVRRPLQPAPAPSVPPATAARPERPSQCAAGPAGPAEEGARWRDQRVLPGSVADLTNPKVRDPAMVLKRHTPGGRRDQGLAAAVPTDKEGDPCPAR